MFAAALIVFRETLEAALFVGIVAAATRGLAGRRAWLAGGVAAGVLGAVLLAAGAEQVSALADGLGQDLVTVGILALALTMLVWHCVWVSTHGQQMALDARRLGHAVSAGQRAPRALALAVALAVLREGAETVLFIAGYTSGNASSVAGVASGGALGLAGGVALGVALYSGLSRIPARALFTVTNVLVALLAAAIASQLARALGQAGLVDAWSMPLWDTSALLSLGSAAGALLHALVGYDPQPSGLQLAFYAGVLVLIFGGTRLARPRLQGARGPAGASAARS